MLQLEHPLLAIDHGDARIGLAATDMLGIGIHPAGTVQTRTADPIAEVAAVARQRQVTGIVLGLPLNMNGSEGPSAQKIRTFADGLKAELPNVPIHFCDERLTTVAAAEKLRHAGKNAKKQKAVIDQAAACEILAHFLREHGHDF